MFRAARTAADAAIGIPRRVSPPMNNGIWSKRPAARPRRHASSPQRRNWITTAWVRLHAQALMSGAPERVQVTELPVRAAKFIARKQWIITGSDDLFVRVFNYNTMEKIKGFEAHSDYLRSVLARPVRRVPSSRQILALFVAKYKPAAPSSQDVLAHTAPSLFPSSAPKHLSSASSCRWLCTLSSRTRSRARTT